MLWRTSSGRWLAAAVVSSVGHAAAFVVVAVVAAVVSGRGQSAVVDIAAAVVSSVGQAAAFVVVVVARSMADLIVGSMAGSLERSTNQLMVGLLVWMLVYCKAGPSAVVFLRVLAFRIQNVWTRCL